MAAVLETLTIPRASAILSAPLAPVAGSSVSRRGSTRFSEFRGLKIRSARSLASVSSRSRLDRRGGRIVCEAQETAIEGELSFGFLVGWDVTERRMMPLELAFELPAAACCREESAVSRHGARMMGEGCGSY
ncbi:hypothetical protein PHJA_001165600 [Phtheirospermum japonicum]|uniref:Uncharacterized protein n=1 Tax=Phtheirospermum japonicum TaxID=374723 RepID=A0A830BR37_9LAMI|nr:hypothetical protein PHJA_001165600 [Phtheirospermum japonicum]